TRLIALTHADLSADELSARLRTSTPPVIARVEEGRVLLDLRTVFPEQDTVLVEALSLLYRTQSCVSTGSCRAALGWAGAELRSAGQVRAPAPTRAWPERNRNCQLQIAN